MDRSALWAALLLLSPFVASASEPKAQRCGDAESPALHAAVLGKAGPVTFHTVERGAHLLPLVAPACFTAAVNAFIAGGAPAERCAESVSE